MVVLVDDQTQVQKQIVELPTLEAVAVAVVVLVDHIVKVVTVDVGF